eukprot:tig00000492_g1571.t1
MPVLDGLGAAEEIRRLEGDGALPPGPLPIVALSANCTREDREACAAAGMDDFHAKPLKIDALLAVVRARLGLPPAPDPAPDPSDRPRPLPAPAVAPEAGRSPAGVGDKLEGPASAEEACT